VLTLRSDGTYGVEVSASATGVVDYLYRLPRGVAFDGKYSFALAKG
jgi:hypothetical protein